MSKVLCIKDLNFNFDYASVLQKSYISEELENVAINSLRKVISEEAINGVSSVLITGKLFEEETLMIDEVDRFVDVLNEFKSLDFIIAPLTKLEENSWYHIINWPKNCHLVSNKINYAENFEKEIIFYQDEINETLQSSEYFKLAVDNEYNRSLNSFLPRDYSVEISNSIAVLDLDSETCEYKANEDIQLVEFNVSITNDMTMNQIVELVKANKITGDGLTFYKCILNGVVNNELAKDLINNLKDSIGDDFDCIYDNHTFKNFDIDTIKNENKDNLIGIFIENVQEKESDKDEARRIIETGLNYLL